MKKSDNSHPDKKSIQRRDFLRNGGTSLLLGMNLRSPLEATAREAGTGTATVHGTHQKTPGATRALTSPVGHYKPELLLLAPEGGEDLNTKSLISQFLELGVAFELDKDWHLPTSPPRDLSAYKACLFPETARDKFDKDLTAFERAGGFVPYMRYYPVRPGAEVSGRHAYIIRHGRDVYFFHMANLTLEGGLTPLDRDFARTLESRSVGSMITEYRNFYFSKYAARNFGPWEEWGDTAYTEFLAKFSAETLKDREWLDLVNYTLEKAHEAAQEIIHGKLAKFKAE